MRRDDTSVGWITFAGVMVTLAGVLNMIWGIAAINSSGFFTSAASYIVSDLQTWGWIAVGVGLLELLAAYSIFQGGEFGRWFGIMAAGINAVSALMPIRAYPFWGICLFALDVMIIYALAAYGGRETAV